VLQAHPVAIVSLSGRLADGVVPDVRDALRDCLADMPTALLLETSGLESESCASLAWLRELSETAAHWPGVPVYVCGPSESVAQCELPAYASVSEGRAAWEDAEPSLRRTLDLPAAAQSPARARDFVAAVCAQWGIKRPVRLAQILVSELVSNAVQYTRSGIGVTVRRFGPGIEVSVRDEGSGLSTELPSDPRGFGLQLVEAMSDAWGSTPTGSGKVVWSRILA
jgi:signal transduction histidine kinase